MFKNIPLKQISLVLMLGILYFYAQAVFGGLSQELSLIFFSDAMFVFLLTFFSVYFLYYLARLVNSVRLYFRNRGSSSAYGLVRYYQILFEFNQVITACAFLMFMFSGNLSRLSGAASEGILMIIPLLFLHFFTTIVKVSESNYQASFRSISVLVCGCLGLAAHFIQHYYASSTIGLIAAIIAPIAISIYLLEFFGHERSLKALFSDNNYNGEPMASKLLSSLNRSVPSNGKQCNVCLEDKPTVALSYSTSPSLSSINIACKPCWCKHIESSVERGSILKSLDNREVQESCEFCPSSLLSS